MAYTTGSRAFRAANCGGDFPIFRDPVKVGNGPFVEVGWDGQIRQDFGRIGKLAPAEQRLARSIADVDAPHGDGDHLSARGFDGRLRLRAILVFPGPYDKARLKSSSGDHQRFHD